jgi:hypothetical protein
MPAWVVKLLFGEMGQTLLLQSWGMVPEKLQTSGFTWQHPQLNQAFKALL